MKPKSAIFYNALNVFHGGDYKKLQKAWERFGDWETAWKERGDNHGSGDKISPEEKWRQVKDLGATLILNGDSDYPALLKEIPHPPFGIYVFGNIEYSQPALAVVGTRSATPQGKEIAKRFANQLGNSGITIISGLALGIDACAHQGALEADGKTIAVLGTPLNNIYPKQNINLAKEIQEKNGAVISEFPFNQEYHPQNFLARNRIISGLSNGIIVIEAPKRSGSLATAKFALEQNREIFVIPGNVTSKNYRGSNELIKAGANIVTEPEDILSYYGISKPAGKNFSNTDAGSKEIIIISALQNSNQECSTEQLLNSTGLEITELNQLLALLTIKGIIKELNGKYFLNS